MLWTKSEEKGDDVTNAGRCYWPHISSLPQSASRQPAVFGAIACRWLSWQKAYMAPFLHSADHLLSIQILFGSLWNSILFLFSLAPKNSIVGHPYDSSLIRIEAQENYNIKCCRSTRLLHEAFVSLLNTAPRSSPLPNLHRLLKTRCLISLVLVSIRIIRILVPGLRCGLKFSVFALHFGSPCQSAHNAITDPSAIKRPFFSIWRVRVRGTRFALTAIGGLSARRHLKR